MTIEINGLTRDRMLRARVTRQMAALFSRLSLVPLTTEVTFFDDDGPKGGVANRCALTVKLPRRPVVRVEHTAETYRAAFDGSVETLERQLGRERARRRDQRRRPKKYYVAKRLLEPEAEAGSTPIVGKPRRPRT